MRNWESGIGNCTWGQFILPKYLYQIDGKYSPNQAVPPEAIVGNWKVDSHKSNIAENNKVTQIEKQVIIILTNSGKYLIMLL